MIVKDDKRQEPPNPDPPDEKPAGEVPEVQSTTPTLISLGEIDDNINTTAKPNKPYEKIKGLYCVI